MVESDVRNFNIVATNESNESRSAFISQASPSLVPTNHHVLSRIFPHYELRSLTVHHSAAADSHVRRVLRHHHVPPPELLRVVLKPGAAQDGGTRLHDQHHAGFQEHGGRQVLSRRREDYVAGTALRTGVDGRLDRCGIVAAAVAGGPEVGDGEVDWDRV